LNNILIGPSSFAEFSKEPLSILKKNNFNVIQNPYKRKITNAELIQLLKQDVIGIIAGLELLNSETLKDSNVKIISRVGSGTDNLELDFLNKNNIKVYSTPDGPTESVAELTISMMINLIRSSFKVNLNMHNEIWKRSIGYELKNKNIIIIGYGRIGKLVYKILNSFCDNLYVVDPFVTDPNIKSITFEESLVLGDIFSLHTNSKKVFFDMKAIKIIKKGSYILNSSRSSSIDEEAIIFGINNKIIDSVWLDVFDSEPYKGNLYKINNLIMTPHTSSYTVDCRVNMELDAVNNLINNFNE